jgi:hypothetical protein
MYGVRTLHSSIGDIFGLENRRKAAQLFKTTTAYCNTCFLCYELKLLNYNDIY